MSDHHRRRARSPISNPTRASAPIIHAGRYGDLHAIPVRRDVFASPSPRSSGAHLETATHYKIKPDAGPRVSDSRLNEARHKSRHRCNTVDSSAQPIIVTPTSRYNVVVGENGRDVRDGRRDSPPREDHRGGEDACSQPASSMAHRRYRDGAYRRGQYSMDAADITSRDPVTGDGLLRVGSTREGRAGRLYPASEYASPRDIPEQYEPRRRSRHGSMDSRSIRPVNISGYGDLVRPHDSRAERERGPPVSNATRGYDKLGDRNSIYGTSSMQTPMPHEYVPTTTVSQVPIYPTENTMPTRRNSVRRPVSVYNEREPDRRESRRDDYDLDDGRARRLTRESTLDSHDAVQARGFGIRPDLLGPSSGVSAPPPVERIERIDSGEHRDRHGRDHDHREREANRHMERAKGRERPIDYGDPRSSDSRLGNGVATGSVAAMAMGLGASAASVAKTSRDSDEEKERGRAERRRRRADSDAEYYRRQREVKVTEEAPVVDLSGRNPVERASPDNDRHRERDQWGERDSDRERHERHGRRREDDRRDAEKILEKERQRQTDEPRSSKSSPQQDDIIDLTDRYPVIERNVAKEENHINYSTVGSVGVAPTPRDTLLKERDEVDGRELRKSENFYEDRDVIASPTVFDPTDEHELRALREAVARGEDVSPLPRPPKEPLERSDPRYSSPRESSERLSGRPIDTHSSFRNDPRYQSSSLRLEESGLSAISNAATVATVSSHGSGGRPSRPEYRRHRSSSTSSNDTPTRTPSRSPSRERRSADYRAIGILSPPHSPSTAADEKLGGAVPLKGIMKPTVPTGYSRLPRALYDIEVLKRFGYEVDESKEMLEAYTKEWIVRDEGAFEGKARREVKQRLVDESHCKYDLDWVMNKDWDANWI